MAEIMQLIGSLDSAGAQPAAHARYRLKFQRPTDAWFCGAVDEKISSIMSAAEDAIMQLKNECRSLLIRVPAKVPPFQQHGWCRAGHCLDDGMGTCG